MLLAEQVEKVGCNYEYCTGCGKALSASVRPERQESRARTALQGHARTEIKRGKFKDPTVYLCSAPFCRVPLLDAQKRTHARRGRETSCGSDECRAYLRRRSP